MWVKATVTSILILLGMPGEHVVAVIIHYSLFIIYEYHYVTTIPYPTSYGLQGTLAGLLYIAMHNNI